MENMKSSYMNPHTLRKNLLSPLRCCSGIAFFLLIPILLNGCADTAASKRMVDDESTTMRHESKWAGAKSFQIEDHHVIIGVLNDEKNLYVRVATTDNGIQQSITTSGCTIWVDADGGQNKIYGIHYPSIKLPEPRVQTTSPPVPNSSNERKDGSPDQQGLEIVSNGGDGRTRITMSEALSLGIEAGIKKTNGYLMYDLTIPYTQIIAQHGPQMSLLPQSIAIALEIEGITQVRGERPAMVGSRGEDQRGQGGMGGGGRGGRGMGGGGMRGGDKPEDMEKTESHGREANETLEEWFIVDL